MEELINLINNDETILDNLDDETVNQIISELSKIELNNNNKYIKPKDDGILKVFEAFSGYGGASFALKNTNIPHKIIGYSEINNSAIKCYNNNHKNIKNYGDIRLIDENKLPDFDLFTGGFPCQDFSNAGKGEGEQGKSGNLFLDIIRIVSVKLPKYILLENVKGLLSHNHKDIFNKIITSLENLGYKVSYDLLNSKDYGIPQNRQRVYIVCCLDPSFDFQFPNKTPSNLVVRDILEINRQNKPINNKRLKEIIQSPTSNKNRNVLFELKGSTPSGNSRQVDRIYDINSYSPTLVCSVNEYLFINQIKQRIIKLTPRECFRLMGFLNDEINLDDITENQQYKLAGNGWDINIVSKIFINMFN
jgi:DNA (cytosine-5)-methyltransferase 1